MTHFVEVGKALNLLVFLLEKHLNEEHFTLLLDQIPAIFSVLRALNWHIEAGSFGHVDLVSDVGVDGQCRRFNVSLTQLSEAALTSGSVFLPNLQFLIGLTLAFLTSSLLILEGKDTIVAGIREWVRVLLEAEEGLGVLAIIACSGASLKTGPALAHFTHLISKLIKIVTAV